MAMGPNAIAHVTSGIAIGENSVSGKTNASTPNTANNTPSIAIGKSAQATNNGSIGIGSNVQSTQTDSIAIGTNAISHPSKGIAIGADTNVASGADSAVAIGDLATIAGVSSQNSVALGYMTKVENRDSVAIGPESTISKNSESSVAIGSRAKVTATINRYDDGGVALGSSSELSSTEVPVLGITAGYDPSTGKQSTNDEKTWKATTAGVSIGSSSITRKLHYLAAGSEDTDAVNVAQLKKLKEYVDNKSNSSSNNTKYVSINSSRSGANSNADNDGATGYENMAIGPGAKATAAANYGLAIGVNAEVDAGNATAIGLNSRATQIDTIAVGTNSKAAAINTTAVGAYAQALGDYAFAGGADSYAYGERGIAIGVHTNEAVLGKLVTTTGSGNNTVNTVNETEFKTFIKYEETLKNLVDNENTRNDLLSDISKLDALVSNPTTLNSTITNQDKRNALIAYQKGVAEARKALVSEGKYTRLGVLHPYGAIGGQSISIGNENLASGAYAVSVGTDAKATNYGTSAYGYQADASGTQSTALGFASKGSGEFSTAVGAAANSSGYTSVALGYASKAESTESIAIGRGANVPAIGNGEPTQGSIAIGRGAQSNAGLSIAIGADAKNELGGTYTGATALGTGAITAGVGSTAIGNQSRANTEVLGLTNNNGAGQKWSYATAVGTSSIAQGTYASSLGTHSQAWGHYSVAIGMQSNGNGRENGARGYGSNAIGLYAHARGLYSTALSSESQALYNESVALGRAAIANAVNSTAIGSGAKTVGMNSVAIGYASSATINSGVALGDYSETNVFSHKAGYDPLTSKQIVMEDYLGSAKNSEYQEQKKVIKEADDKIYKANEILKEAEYKRIYAKTDGEREEANKQTSANRKIRDDAISEKNAAMKKIKDKSPEASTWEGSAAGVSVGNAELGITRQINNVAAGTLDTDAVNVAQLKRVVGMIQQGNTININQMEQRLQKKIDSVSKKADAGTASAIAQSSIPQVSAPGKTGIGIGSGHYGNQSAVSLGASRMSDNGKWIFKGSFSSNTQGKVGVGAGALYQW